MNSCAMRRSRLPVGCACDLCGVLGSLSDPRCRQNRFGLGETAAGEQHDGGHDVEDEAGEDGAVEAVRHRDDRRQRGAEDGEEPVDRPAPGDQPAAGRRSAGRSAVATTASMPAAGTRRAAGRSGTAARTPTAMRAHCGHASAASVSGVGDQPRTRRRARSSAAVTAGSPARASGGRAPEQPGADGGGDEQGEQRHRERQRRVAEQQGEALDHRDLDEHEAEPERRRSRRTAGQRPGMPARRRRRAGG